MTSSQTAHERRWAALTLLSVAQFVVILDITIVNIALPAIQSALDFSHESLPWVVNAYMLTFGGFLLLGGRIADLFGRRRVFMAGLILFSVASIWCGFAQSGGELIAARAVQGLGGAILSPVALSLVAATFQEGGERNKAMGVWGAVAGAGGATGVVLGGVLTDGPGWEWVFWVSVPFTLVAALLAPVFLAESADDDRPRHLDLAGAVTVTAGLSAFIFALVQTVDYGLAFGRVVLPLLAAAALLGAFVVIESRSAFPLVPFRIFRHRSLATANGAMLLFAAAIVAMSYFVSLYLQQVLQYSPVQAGLAFLPMAVGQIIFSQVAARLLGRLGVVRVLVIGLVLSGLGLLWLASISADGSFLVDVLGPAVMLSAGGGFAVVGVITAAVAGIPEHDYGLAGGLINTAQQIGGALGLASLSTLAAWRATDIAGGAVPGGTALTSGFRLSFLVAAAVTLIAAGVVALLLRPRGTPPVAEVAETAEGKSPVAP